MVSVVFLGALDKLGHTLLDQGPGRQHLRPINGQLHDRDVLWNESAVFSPSGDLLTRTDGRGITQGPPSAVTSAIRNSVLR